MGQTKKPPIWSDSPNWKLCSAKTLWIQWKKRILGSRDGWEDCYRLSRELCRRRITCACPINCVIGHSDCGRICVRWGSSRLPYAECRNESIYAPLRDQSTVRRLAKKWCSRGANRNVSVKLPREGSNRVKKEKKLFGSKIKIREQPPSSPTSDISGVVDIPSRNKKKRRSRHAKVKLKEVEFVYAAFQNVVWGATLRGKSKEDDDFSSSSSVSKLNNDGASRKNVIGPRQGPLQQPWTTAHTDLRTNFCD